MIPRPLPRIAFATYALALATATHWPALAIEGHGITRLDLFIHVGAFGLWTLLCTASGFFGPWLTRRNILRSGVVALLYASVDEITQGVPVLRRTVDPLDLAANATGVVLAVVALHLLSRWSGPVGRPPETPPSGPEPSEKA